MNIEIDGVALQMLMDMGAFTETSELSQQAQEELDGFGFVTVT